MDVDMSALKQLERDKEISMDVLIGALSEALLNAYEKTPGAVPGSRVEIDRRSGKVTVFAPELDEEGNRIGEFDHTP
ncbi:MAG: transcription termination/antitermination protein NusA, partial [Actinobacteria bacterium]|nr:transcription termination/antitermination protein NusA [Actinomycetota bacterium]